MQKLLLYLILLCSLLSYSQNKRIEITGMLSDKLGKVVDAHVINITSKQGTFTNINGEYTIPAKLGDEIKITSIQHHDLNVVVAGISIKSKKLDLLLNLKEYVLEEVEVKKTYLSGNLGTDSKEIKKSDKQAVMENLGFNPYPKRLTKIEREIKTAYAGGIQYGLGVVASLDYIINSASGRIDKLEKQKELLDNDSKLKQLKVTYKDYIVNELKVDSTKISRFLYFAHFDDNFTEAYKKGNLELIQFLKNQAQLFNIIQKENKSKITD
ncbi:hypothetical protein [uncultured Tenacibaculum sp.]|uniref:hypothetical protein n=1 Tax=uncultured Tenacibaculum sp. TaxID=174713 RepID=UPI00261A8EA1|nr:hypothetical protein [uncultured Tenacibaculum sp.]